MTEIVLSADDAEALRAELIGGDTERCAVIYASQTTRKDGTIRLLAREVEFPLGTDYLRRGLLEAELAPEFVARVTKRARRERTAIIFAHSHPGTEPPIFSRVDDKGERRLADFLAHRHPECAHAAIVLSAGGMRARRLGEDEDARLISLGVNREVLFDPSGFGPSSSERFDRQVRAFGSNGQAVLQRLRVAIVGLGGTGSIVAQQLAHLGVRDFILVDPDTLEPSNLNRVANATPANVGQPKVEVAAKYIRDVAPGSHVACVQGDVIQANTAKELLEADLIFGCTDSHGSRAVLQQVAYQYMIPCIDMGVTIIATKGRISHIFGRVQLLGPSLACFTCDGLLDANEVRRDMMTAFERQADPYIQGERQPAPAVMSLNGTVASLAITMMLFVFAGVPGAARHILYNAMSSTLRSVRAQQKANCFVCSHSGALARGDAWPLFAREA